MSSGGIDAALAKGRGRRRSLAELVAWGTVAVVSVGGALFGWLAWLQSHRPAPWHDRAGWWAWLSQVGGTAMFDASRTTATILAVVGVGGAALVAYRRQATAELTYEFTVRAHEVAIESQQTAAQQLQLDSQKYELDRQRHQLEEQRRKDDRERELRARFAAIAEQLDSASSAVRHAGAYALASLADDWHGFGNDPERQVCVNLLCAQLRTPRIKASDDPAAAASDLEVRRTMIAVLRSRRPVDAEPSDGWNTCSIDLSGADLSDFDLSEMDLHAASLNRTNLTAANFRESDLSHSRIRFAKLHDTKFDRANLTEANLRGSGVSAELAQSEPESREPFWEYYSSFRGAQLQKAELGQVRLLDANFYEADLTEASAISADFRDCSFNAAQLNRSELTHADLSGANFRGADLSGAKLSNANITGAKFEGSHSDDATKWPSPDDDEPPF